MPFFNRVKHSCVLLILLVVDMFRYVYCITVVVIVHKLLRLKMRVELGVDKAVSPQGIPHRPQTRTTLRVEV